MNAVLIMVFIAVPLLELAVLIKVGQWLGFWPTFMWIGLTFFAGAFVVSRSGFAAARRLQQAMASGEPPAAAMLEGALVMLAGVLLMTPGFIADSAGLVLLLPPCRRWIAALVAGRFFGTGWTHVGPREAPRGPFAGAGPSGADSAHASDDGPVIEGEFERLDERPVDPRRRSGPTRPH